jgi:hypothetical protein
MFSLDAKQAALKLRAVKTPHGAGFSTKHYIGFENGRLH